MRYVKLKHPNGNLTTSVPESAVPEMSRGGWVPDESEAPVQCHACGQDLPSKSPPDPREQTSAPAAAGADSSKASTGRRGSKGASE